MLLLVIGVRGRCYCPWGPVVGKLLPPCEARVAKGVTHHGKEDQGEVDSSSS